MHNVTPSSLVDDVIERYIIWREACLAVRDTYSRWSERRARYEDHHAALDREETAALRYAESLDRMRRALWPDPLLAEPVRLVPPSRLRLV